MVTPQKVKELAPELIDSSDARVQLFIDIAMRQVAPGPWGDSYETAVLLLAAHIATGGVTQGAEAPIKSMSVGGTSISYGTTTSERSGLDATEYGRMYQDLMAAHIVAPLVL